MAKFFTNFNDQPVGDMRANGQTAWSVKIENGTGDFRVLSDGVGAKYIRIGTSSNPGTRVLAYNPLDGYQDLETLTLFSAFKSGSTGVPGRFGISYNRYEGTTEATTKGYSVNFTPASSTKSLFLTEDSTGTVNFTNYNWTMGAKYWLRHRTIANNQFVKIWPYGTAEPGTWTLTSSYVGPTIANPYSGIGTYMSDAFFYVYQFSAGTDGDAAQMYPDNQFLEDQFIDTDKALTAHVGEYGASWVNNGMMGMQITAERARPSGLGSVTYASGVPSGPDMYLESQFTYMSNSGDLFLTARHSTSAMTYYSFGYTGSAWQIRYTVGGIMMVLATATTALNPFQTYAVKFEVIGNKLTGYVEGVPILTATDSNITATGRAGIMGDATGGTAAGMQAEWIRGYNYVPIPSSTPSIGGGGGWGSVSGFGTPYGEVNRQTALNITLSIADASHGHTADNIAVTSVHTLAIANTSHSHTATSPALTSVHLLAIANASHTLVDTGPLALIRNIILAVDNALHAHYAENLALITGVSLLVANATHGVTSDNINLSQAQTLAIANALHAHSVDSPTIIEAKILAIANAIHSLADTGPLDLTSVHNLIADNALHGHTAEAVAALIQSQLLAVQNAIHALKSDNIAIIQFTLLNKPDDAVHGVTDSGPMVAQNYWLIIDDATHTVKSTNIPKIINWDELGVGYGQYIPKFTSGGELEIDTIEQGQIVPVFGSTGELEAVEINGGQYIPTFIKTGQF